MDMRSRRLGVDFGTSNTVAVYQRADGAVAPLLFDASPMLSSGVFAGPDGLLTGADAERASAGNPAGYEPNPKRRIDDGTVWLGDREIAVVDLIGAVLARVAAEAYRVAGGPPDQVVLTHPAAWSRTRLAVLGEAARRAGLTSVSLTSEPVAAAAYFSTVLGRDLSPGRCVLVYDLGGGTFDVSVVRRTPHGLEVLINDGLPDLGGLDLDALVVAHARSLTTADTGWGRLDWPEAATDQRARRTLWAGARAAKEQLTRHAGSDVHVPLIEQDIHLTRGEFESAAGPHLDRTVALTLSTLRAAGVPRESVEGLFLVGGSSRIPLVATLLHQRLGIPPTVLDQPELVVAQGSLCLAPPQPAPAGPPAAPWPPPPVSVPPVSVPPVSVPPGSVPPGSVPPGSVPSGLPFGGPIAPPTVPARGTNPVLRRRLGIALSAVLAVLLVAGTGYVLWDNGLLPFGSGLSGNGRASAAQFTDSQLLALAKPFLNDGGCNAKTVVDQITDDVVCTERGTASFKWGVEFQTGDGATRSSQRQNALAKATNKTRFKSFTYTLKGYLTGHGAVWVKHTPGDTSDLDDHCYLYWDDDRSNAFATLDEDEFTFDDVGGKPACEVDWDKYLRDSFGKDVSLTVS
ncbi:MAG TPA: Hsp70 family protein [Rugosimonospora sp.]